MTHRCPPGTLVPLLLLGALLAACAPDPVPADIDTDSVPAAEFVLQLGGVANYDYHLPPDGPASVVLMGTDGSTRGSLTLTGSPSTGAVSVLVTEDGAIATTRTLLLDGGADAFWTRVRLEAEGQVLEMDTLSSEDLTVRRVELAVPAHGASEAPPSSEVRGDDLALTFVAFEDGQAADPAAMQLWLASAGVDKLLASRAVYLLLLVQLDSRLLGTMARSQQEENGLHGQSAVLVQAIHKSQQCDIVGSLFASANGLCLTCLGTLLAAPGTAGATLLVAVGNCAACTGLGSASVYQYMKCRQSQQEALTEEYCRDWCTRNVSLAHEGKVNAMEHDPCECTCNKDKCEVLLRSRLLPGQSLCSANCLEERCGGRVQTCGDGLIEAYQGCEPEECDPGASPTGCPEGKHCEDCKCVDAGLPCGQVRCAPGEECHGCGFWLICGPPGGTCCSDWTGHSFTCAPGTVCRQCMCLSPDAPPPPYDNCGNW